MSIKHIVLTFAVTVFVSLPLQAHEDTERMGNPGNVENGNPVSRYRIEDELHELLNRLHEAAHKEDLAAFEPVIGSDFIALRDFGGMTSQEGRGMPNFAKTFGLNKTGRTSQNDTRGWRNLEFLIGSGHFEKTETGYCGPYYGQKINWTQKEQLCFGKDAERGWLITHKINAGD